MSSTLEVIYWRDIPAQVMARQGRTVHRVELSPRFQVAIDQAASRAGKTDDDGYLAEWHKERTTGNEDPEAAATEEASRLEAAFCDEVLEGYVRNMGRAP
ncbi:MAG: virulence factor [Acidimicrobiia bacterium]|nr:MAG: virulence factor [Acidimicrobiia bacterium]